MRLHNLAAELVQLNVDVILATGTPPARAAQRATTRIPSCSWAVADPVEADWSRAWHSRGRISPG